MNINVEEADRPFLVEAARHCHEQAAVTVSPREREMMRRRAAWNENLIAELDRRKKR